VKLLVIGLILIAISIGGCASYKVESQEPEVTYDPVTGEEHYYKETIINIK
jgi:hypothetical protein